MTHYQETEMKMSGSVCVQNINASPYELVIEICI
jgi:hypothetical protein